MGVAALVKVAAIIIDNDGKNLHLDRVRAVLVLAGIVYFSASVLISV